MTYINLEKLAANTAVLRRYARRHIWNAPHRGIGERAERAVVENRRLRRQLRRAERAVSRWEQDSARDVAEHGKKVEHWWDDEPAPALGNALRARAEALRDRVSQGREVARGAGRGRAASYSRGTDRISLHGTGEIRADGAAEPIIAGSPSTRLMIALHENNERRAARHIERAMGRSYRDGGRARGNMPISAGQVLETSTHFTPSVPLRDINIANTAWGPGADVLRHNTRLARFEPKPGRHISELEELAREVPGAREILQNARVLPGAPAHETPRYVQHARQRLVNAWVPASPAVQQRLEQIVDRHEASNAVSPRFNRNELHMIDSAFHRKYNPGFPELLRKRVPSPQVPATPLPAEQRGAFREARAAQPGLTRKHFLAQRP